MLFLYVFLSDCKCLENTIRKEIGFCILISLGKIIWTFTVVYFGCKKKKRGKIIQSTELEKEYIFESMFE